MDSLTQIVLGASVGEAVLGKKVGNRAMLWGAVAGTIPDLDVLFGFFTDTVTAIEWHRGVSHSLFFAILASPLLGWGVGRLYPKEDASWRDWSWLMFWGLFTHSLLDAFTTWGTQLLWPLDFPLAFQSIFVIDPLYTLPLLIALILVLRQPGTSPKRGRYNRLGLVLSTSYLALTVVLKGLAYRQFLRNLELQGIEFTEISSRPTPFNTLLWTANVDMPDAYLIAYYSFLDSKDIQFYTYPKNHDLLGDFGKGDKVKRLIAITQGWYTLTQSGDGVLLNDLRFGPLSLHPGEDRFAFSYQLISKGDTVTVKEVPKSKRDAKELLRALWERICGN
ncbi:MAG: metal-dependent hydrolase [Bacteroidota bacterium]